MATVSYDPRSNINWAESYGKAYREERSDREKWSKQVLDAVFAIDGKNLAKEEVADKFLNTASVRQTQALTRQDMMRIHDENMRTQGLRVAAFDAQNNAAIRANEAAAFQSGSKLNVMQATQSDVEQAAIAQTRYNTTLASQQYDPNGVGFDQRYGVATRLGADGEVYVLNGSGQKLRDYAQTVDDATKTAGSIAKFNSLQASNSFDALKDVKYDPNKAMFMVGKNPTNPFGLSTQSYMQAIMNSQPTNPSSPAAAAAVAAAQVVLPPNSRGARFVDPRRVSGVVTPQTVVPTQRGGESEKAITNDGAIRNQLSDIERSLLLLPAKYAFTNTPETKAKRAQLEAQRNEIMQYLATQ